jgi:hypothetical protein
MPFGEASYRRPHRAFVETFIADGGVGEDVILVGVATGVEARLIEGELLTGGVDPRIKLAPRLKKKLSASLTFAVPKPLLTVALYRAVCITTPAKIVLATTVAILTALARESKVASTTRGGGDFLRKSAMRHSGGQKKY